MRFGDATAINYNCHTVTVDAALKMSHFEIRKNGRTADNHALQTHKGIKGNRIEASEVRNLAQIEGADFNTVKRASRVLVPILPCGHLPTWYRHLPTWYRHNRWRNRAA
jgi:hypothetical protein